MFMGRLDPSPPEYFRGAAYLNSLPEKEAFRQIVDSYRLRVEDVYVFDGDACALYAEQNPVADFEDYLYVAEKKGGILPRWWSREKRGECVQMGCRSETCNLYHAVEKSDIVEAYGDRLMPMKLRMIAQMVTGVRVGRMWRC